MLLLACSPSINASRQRRKKPRWCIRVAMARESPRLLGSTGPSRTQRSKPLRDASEAPKEGTSFKLTFVRGELFDKELLVI